MADDVMVVDEENTEISREVIIEEITNLANIVSSITGYATKNLLVEVSKITRDQLANETIKPDFGLFRVQLFKYLSRYSELVEQKSRILAPYLINLYRKELRNVHFTRVQNLIQSNVKAKNEFDEPSVIKQINHQEECITGKISRPKHISGALKALMLIFAKFTSPKTVYREPELYEIYLELLLSTDVELQNAALSCLLAYKHNYVIPYIQNLQNLLVEKKLNDELVRFTVDKQNCVIAESHRANIMPIVMRILYGRFYAKSIVRGKMKRMAIFRFFASCQPDELDHFIGLVLSLFFTLYELQSKDLSSVLLNVIQSYDPTCTIPLTKLQSNLGIIENMFVRLAPSLTEHQISLLFSVTLICAVLINLGIENGTKCSTQTMNMLKSLRLSAFKTIIQFFRSFHMDQFTHTQIQCLFQYVMEPMIFHYNETLVAKELIVQISVARLFVFWSGKPGLFPLFNYRFSDCLKCQSPISLLCNTLLSGGTPKNVQFQLINAIDSLLRASDDEETVDINYKSLFAELLQCDLQLSDEYALGVRIVFPEVKKILSYLSTKIPHDMNSTKKKVPFVFLDVLNRISGFVDDEKMGGTFAVTFLSYLGGQKPTKDKEKMVELLSTLTAFSRYFTDPLHALRRVTRFLSQLDERVTREALINFIYVLKENSNFPNSTRKHLHLLSELESYDRNRIEEPDYDRRYRGFEKMEQLYKEALQFDADVLPLFVHSHSFSIKNSSDLALRKTASAAFRQLINYMARNLSDTNCKTVLHDHVVPLILSGINSTNEFCRMEFVACLSNAIAMFPIDHHFKFLQPLNKSWKDDEGNMIDDFAIKEGEQNFFENTIHLQMHRRQRAFNRLANQLISHEVVISGEVLLRYILPLIKPYLLETVSKLSAVSDESLRLFSVILENVSWRRYYQFLEFYISQINNAEKTKGVVRTLIAILGSFHFDLKNVEMASSFFESNTVKHNVEQCPTKPVQKKQKTNKSRITDLGLEEEDEEESLLQNVGDDDNDELNNSNAERSNASDEDDDDDEEEEEENNRNIADKNKLLNTKRIFEIMITKILPQLRQALQSTQNYHHKKSNCNDYAVDEELLTRAPIVLSMAKVLQKMPERVQNDYLNGLIAALNRLLLSRSISVRQGARKIMGQFMSIIGPKYLAFVIKELRQALLKGFQLHVMIFTMHTIIGALEQIMQSGDLDACFADVFEVCKLELFGDVAEERKFISASAVPEAKTNKSIDTFIYLGKFISEDKLSMALEMVKETINAKPKGNVIRKLGELLRGFSTGLHANKGIDVYFLLKFICNVLKQYLVEMLAQQRSSKSSEQLEMEQRKNGYRQQHCLLLPPEPKRIGELVKYSLKSKVSIFVEFALQLLADVLKARPLLKQSDGDDENERVVEKDSRILEALNNFVPQIIDCLRLKFSKIIALALRCLTILLRYPLEKIKREVQTIMERLFIILSEYSGMGQAGNDPVIIDINQMLFKCLTFLMRDYPILSITPRRMEILLNYTETNILDNQRQATSFLLIKAIIARKIEDEKVDNIIDYLSEISITCHGAHIRTQCRQVILLYLNTHPAGKNSMEHWLEFFANQTEYEYEAGRLSAMEMLNSIFDIATEEILSQLSLFIFMKLATRLANDESDECKRFSALALQKLFVSVSESAFSDIFSVAKDWLASKKDSVQLLALKIFCEIAHAQTNAYKNRNVANVGSKLFEIAELLFNNFSKEETNVFEELSEGVIIATYEYFNAYIKDSQENFLKILSNSIGQLKKFFEVLNDALRCISSQAIQLSVSKFLHHLLLTSTTPTQTTKMKSASFSLKTALSEHYPCGFKSVCLALCTQLYNVDFRAIELADQAVKNLLNVIPLLNDEEFNTVCIKLSGICWREVSKQSEQAIKRQNIFKLAAACALTIDSEKLNPLCIHLLPNIYREMSRKSDKHTDELCQLATEVGDVFRSKLGEKRYSAHLLQCQKTASAKYEKRRKAVKTLAVVNPAAAAFRKQKQHERKRIAKKRKLDELRPHRVTKRKRLAATNQL